MRIVILRLVSINFSWEVLLETYKNVDRTNNFETTVRVHRSFSLKADTRTHTHRQGHSHAGPRSWLSYKDASALALTHTRTRIPSERGRHEAIGDS